MRPERFLAALVGLGLVISALACGGTRASSPTPSASPYVATVKTLVTQKTSDATAPESLETLDLSGADTDDEHAFDAVLGAP